MFKPDLFRSEVAARSPAIAVAVLVPLCIPMANAWIRMDTKSGDRVVGTPPPWVFAVTWSMICAILIWVGIFAALRMTSLWYVYGTAGSLCLTVVLCLLWLHFYKQQPTDGLPIQLLAATMFMAQLTMAILSSAPTDYEPATTALTVPYSLIVFWTIFATMLNLQEANKENT